jgi:hypothetical protein
MMLPLGQAGSRMLLLLLLLLVAAAASTAAGTTTETTKMIKKSIYSNEAAAVAVAAAAAAAAKAKSANAATTAMPRDDAGTASGRSAAVDLSRWMQHARFAPGTTLQNVTLPGTHDSGAYNLSSEIAPGTMSPQLQALYELAEKLGVPIGKDVIQPWAKAQQRSLYEQMRGGIRYFDIRCCWDYKSATWRTFHYAMGHAVLSVLLRDVHRFMQEHTGEIVVLEISHMQGNATLRNKLDLARDVQALFGAMLYPRTRGFTATLQQMVQSGERVLVSISDAAAIQNNTRFFFGDTIINTYANSDVLSTMMAYNNARVQDFVTQYYSAGGYANHLYKVSWTLTPSADTILGSLRPGAPRSLHQLSAIANKQLGAWAGTIQQRYKNAYPRLGNIVIVDTFEESAVTRIVQQQQQQQQQQQHQQQQQQQSM